MKKLKVLNLYAGIGGNRKLWEDVEVIAIELNESTTAIYKDLYLHDEMIIGDAHKYLLDHFKEFDFIWASPPCPTHSRLGLLNYNKGQKLKYPDMKLYQEIIILENFYNGKYVIENVKGYYEPLIHPYEAGRHYFWSNFRIGNIKSDNMPIRNDEGLTAKVKMERRGYDIKDFHGFKGDKRTMFNNCVEPELGLYILNCARNIITKQNTEQLDIFE